MDDERTVQLWPLSIYMTDRVPEEFFAGKQILIQPLGVILKLHNVYFVHEGKTYYWYVPLPPGVELRVI